jgi:putative transposase
MLRDEVLKALDEARVLVEAWRKTYNRIRPHSSLGDLTPEQFIAKYKDSERSRKTPLLGGSVFG